MATKKGSEVDKKEDSVQDVNLGEVVNACSQGDQGLSSDGWSAKGPWCMSRNGFIKKWLL